MIHLNDFFTQGVFFKWGMRKNGVGLIGFNQSSPSQRMPPNFGNNDPEVKQGI
jgi:hypothetical protein